MRILQILFFLFLAVIAIGFGYFAFTDIRIGQSSLSEPVEVLY